MSHVTIKRCPTCPDIRRHAEEVAAALSDDLSYQARVEDGVTGEFAVLVDGVPVIQRNGDTLPSIGEVDAAVENAAGTPTA